MQMAEVGHVSHRNRQHAGEVVVVEVEEVSEVGELRRERAVEDVVGEVEEAERRARFHTRHYQCCWTTYYVESIDKANRNFLRGDSNEKKKIHLINWEYVCKPKHRGGLGLKKTADMNQAMLVKASWRIFQNDPGLWVDVYRKKYLQDSCIESSNSIAPADCSNTWRGIVHGVELMRRNLKWRIGDGAKIKFWCDLWIISVPSGFGVSGHDKLIWNATANVIWNYVDEWFSAQSKASMQSMFSYTMFSWCKPPENFYKLDIDGSRSSSSGCIGAGGVLRDHLGIWIDGFQVNLGTGELMLKSDTSVHPLGSLLDSCSVVMSKLLNVSIKHIFRECNMVADALAKNSINHDLGLISFDVVPAHAIQVVLDDLAGVTRARRTGCYSSL
ncbi:hypothetical protein ACLB2K_032446 [Fragaria x ananassa]